MEHVEGSPASRTTSDDAPPPLRHQAAGAEALRAVRARHPDVEIAASETAEGIRLSMIRVARELRRQGKAEAALGDLLSYADGRRKPVVLTAERVGDGASDRALERWYRRHGFVANRGRNKNWSFREAMIREPRAQLEHPMRAPDAAHDVPAAAHSLHRDRADSIGFEL